MQAKFTDYEKGGLNQEQGKIHVGRSGALEVAVNRAIESLIFTDEGLRKVAIAHARAYFNTDQVQVVQGWEEIRKTLSSYKSIKDLVFYFHGACESINVGGGNSADSFPAATQFLSKVYMPRVTRQISIEGCNVGLCPDKAIDFGAIFNAPRLSAWNVYWFRDEIRTTHAPEAKEIVDKLFKDYIFSEQADKKNNLIIFWLEWSRADGKLEPIPTYPDIRKIPKQEWEEAKKEWIKDVSDWKISNQQSSKLCRATIQEITGSSLEELKINAETISKDYQLENDALLKCQQVLITYPPYPER